MRVTHTNLRHTSRISNPKKEEEPGALPLFFFERGCDQMCACASQKNVWLDKAVFHALTKRCHLETKRCTKPFDFLRHSRSAR
jgi:hypothetical protein